MLGACGASCPPECPRWNVIGAAGEPAIPGVALGHNERIAWGITIVGVDQADIVVLETDRHADQV
ncbi:MAG: penicillin acylase family protein [Gemmataceae bacterium]